MKRIITCYLFILFMTYCGAMESGKDVQFLQTPVTTPKGLIVERFTNKTPMDRVMQDLKIMYFEYYQRQSFKPDNFEQRWTRISANGNYCMLVAYQKHEGSKLHPVMFIDGTVFDSMYHDFYMRLDSVYIRNNISEQDWEAKEMSIFQQVFPYIEQFSREKGASVMSTNCGDVYSQERRLFSTVMSQADPKDNVYFQKRLS